MTTTTTTSPPRSLYRHLAVTVVATPANFALFAALLHRTTWPAPICNLLAASTLSLPTYLASRAWVWSSTTTSLRQPVLFWLSTAVSVALASATLVFAETLDAGATLINLTPMLTYGLLWIVRFTYLDRVLFRTSEQG